MGYTIDFQFDGHNFIFCYYIDATMDVADISVNPADGKAKAWLESDKNTGRVWSYVEKNMLVPN